MTGISPADDAIIHIIINAMGIHEKKSRFIRPGYAFTIKAKIAKASIEAVNTSPEQTNIILALTFLMKKGVTPKRNML